MPILPAFLAKSGAARIQATGVDGSLVKLLPQTKCKSATLEGAILADAALGATHLLPSAPIPALAAGVLNARQEVVD